MQVIECEQGTDEWFAARLGVVTASKFKDVMAKGNGKTRRSYMIKLVAERLSGQMEKGFTNAAMEWGTQTEPEARDSYAFLTGHDVQLVGFCKRNENEGASPDSLVNDDGLLEIKCPNTSTQIETVLSGEVPSTHKAQIQGQLYITEREWCDFVSFDPRIQGDASMFIKRVYRDGTYIKNLQEELELFVEDMLEMTALLKGESLEKAA